MWRTRWPTSGGSWNVVTRASAWACGGQAACRGAQRVAACTRWRGAPPHVPHLHEQLQAPQVRPALQPHALRRVLRVQPLRLHERRPGRALEGAGGPAPRGVGAAHLAVL